MVRGRLSVRVEAHLIVSPERRPDSGSSRKGNVVGLKLKQRTIR